MSWSAAAAVAYQQQHFPTASRLLLLLLVTSVRTTAWLSDDVFYHWQESSVSNLTAIIPSLDTISPTAEKNR
jgi:hypothetical protein